MGGSDPVFGRGTERIGAVDVSLSTHSSYVLGEGGEVEARSWELEVRSWTSEAGRWAGLFGLGESADVSLCPSVSQKMDGRGSGIGCGEWSLLGHLLRLGVSGWGFRAGDRAAWGDGCLTFDTFFTRFEGGCLASGIRAEDCPARRGGCLTLSQCVTEIGRQGIGDRVWGMGLVGAFAETGRLRLGFRAGDRADRRGGCLTFDTFFTRFEVGGGGSPGVKIGARAASGCLGLGVRAGDRPARSGGIPRGQAPFPRVSVLRPWPSETEPVPRGCDLSDRNWSRSPGGDVGGVTTVASEAGFGRLIPTAASLGRWGSGTGALRKCGGAARGFARPPGVSAFRVGLGSGVCAPGLCGRRWPVCSVRATRGRRRLHDPFDETSGTRQTMGDRK